MHNLSSSMSVSVIVSSMMWSGPWMDSDSPRHSTPIGAFFRVSSLVGVYETIDSSSRFFVWKVAGTEFEDRIDIGEGERRLNFFDRSHSESDKIKFCSYCLSRAIRIFHFTPQQINFSALIFPKGENVFSSPRRKSIFPAAFCSTARVKLTILPP